MRQAEILAKNVNTVADTAKIDWRGGRTALSIVASSYPTTCQLEMIGPDGSTAIAIGSNITANGVTIFDAPEGLYYLHLSGGTATALYATLSSIVYT